MNKKNSTAAIGSLNRLSLLPRSAQLLRRQVPRLRYLHRLRQAKVSLLLEHEHINGSKVPIREQLKIAAEAGYDAVELWLRDVDKFTSEGGDLTALRKEILDLGLGVDSAIAFGKWIVNDPEERKAGLEQSKRDMDTIRHLGGRYIARASSRSH